MNILIIDDEMYRHEWLIPRLRKEFPEAAIHSVFNSHGVYTIMGTTTFDLAFFDHDLGLGDDNGSKIAGRMIMEGHPPKAVVIQSANSVGTLNILSKFRSAGIPALVFNFIDMLHEPEILMESIQGMLPKG